MVRSENFRVFAFSCFTFTHYYVFPGTCFELLRKTNTTKYVSPLAFLRGVAVRLFSRNPVVDKKNVSDDSTSQGLEEGKLMLNKQITIDSIC